MHGRLPTKEFIENIVVVIQTILYYDNEDPITNINYIGGKDEF